MLPCKLGRKKKRILETICSTIVTWYIVVPYCNGLFIFRN